MGCAQDMEQAARDARRVCGSWRACLIALVLAAIGVAPWFAYSFVPELFVADDRADYERAVKHWIAAGRPPDLQPGRPASLDDYEYQRLAWAWLFYASGVPLLIIAGVFYVMSLVQGIAVLRRRPVVGSWLAASCVLVVAFCVFAWFYLE
jgi:hypothetical protein